MNPPKMPIHIGDYHRDTGHLRATEHGAYLLLMFHYWSTGSLPGNDDHLAAIARLSSAEWKRVKGTLQAFFKDGWKHSRIDYDLEKARCISEAARLAGKASGRVRSVKSSLNDRSDIVQPTIEPLNHLKKDYTPNGVSKYAFEDGIIRLTQKDFDQWQKSYSYLDLAAELLSLSKWAQSEGKNWFHAIKGALAKRNRQVKESRDKPKTDSFKWASGMEGII